MLQLGPPSLYYYCAVVLHSCIVLPPVGHSPNHEYHCCQLTRQSSCVSNFYHTFNVFTRLSLVIVCRRSKLKCAIAVDFFTCALFKDDQTLLDWLGFHWRRLGRCASLQTWSLIGLDSVGVHPSAL